MILIFLSLSITAEKGFMLESDSFALGDRQLGGAVVHRGPVEGRHQGLARLEVQRLHGDHGLKRSRRFLTGIIIATSYCCRRSSSRRSGSSSRSPSTPNTTRPPGSSSSGAWPRTSTSCFSRSSPAASPSIPSSGKVTRVWRSNACVADYQASSF